MLFRSQAARAFAEENDVREPFSAILDSKSYRKRRRSEKWIAELMSHEAEATPSA